MLSKKIYGTQNALYFIDADGFIKPLSMRSYMNMLKTRKIYEKQRALCGAIKIQWQRTLGK